MKKDENLKKKKNLRKYFCYIEKGLEKGYNEGNVIIFSKPSIYSEKGVRRIMELLDIKMGERKEVAIVIGLGYADFKDENEYKEKLPKVVEKKIKEIIGQRGPKWKRIQTPTITFDRPILEKLAQRVFLTTTESILDIQYKRDKIKIRGYRGLLKHAFKNRKIFQKIIDKEEFKNKIIKYVEKTLLDERWW